MKRVLLNSGTSYPTELKLSLPQRRDDGITRVTKLLMCGVITDLFSSEVLCDVVTFLCVRFVEHRLQGRQGSDPGFLRTGSELYSTKG